MLKNYAGLISEVSGLLFIVAEGLAAWDRGLVDGRGPSIWFKGSVLLTAQT